LSGGRTDKNITDNTNGLDAPAIPTAPSSSFFSSSFAYKFPQFLLFFKKRFSTLAQLFWLFVWEKKGDAKNFGK
jgi:hypothetical protein